MDATGTEVTVVDSTMIIATATLAHVWTRSLSIKMRSAQKIALCISGKVMENATMRTMFVVATGTVETVVGTAKPRITGSTVIAKSASVAIHLYPRPAMEDARCLRGVETVTATTKTITAVVIGMAETVVEKRQHFYTAKTAVAKTRVSRANSCATNHATNLPGRGTKLVTMKITIVVAGGTAETAAVPTKITFTAKSACVWTRKNGPS